MAKKKSKRKAIPIKSLLKLKNSKVKMSEIMWEFAGDYIQLGEDLERKQNLLNSASSAWNIANLPPDKRKEALNYYLKSFKFHNPGIDEVDDIKKDMELLIKIKLEKFDQIKKQIFNAQIYDEGEKLRITVASAYIPNI